MRAHQRLVVPLVVALSAVLVPGVARAANSWAGTWSTNYGPVTLTASGSGTYGGAHSGTLKGGVSGNVDSGTWLQDDGAHGTFKFTMDTSGQSFTGTYTNAVGGGGSWSGSCSSGSCLSNSSSTSSGSCATPGGGSTSGSSKPKHHRRRRRHHHSAAAQAAACQELWDGVWASDNSILGTITATQSGTTVTATYQGFTGGNGSVPGDTGTLTGTLTTTAAGGEWKGTISSKTYGSGTFDFTLTSGETFEGTFTLQGQPEGTVKATHA